MHSVLEYLHVCSLPFDIGFLPCYIHPMQALLVHLPRPNGRQHSNREVLSNDSEHIWFNLCDIKRTQCIWQSMYHLGVELSKWVGLIDGRVGYKGDEKLPIRAHSNILNSRPIAKLPYVLVGDCGD